MDFMEEDGPCQRVREDVRGSGMPNVMVVHVELIYERGEMIRCWAAKRWVRVEKTRDDARGNMN